MGRCLVFFRWVLDPFRKDFLDFLDEFRCRRIVSDPPVETERVSVMYIRVKWGNILFASPQGTALLAALAAAHYSPP